MNNWKETEASLEKEYEFTTFRAAMDWMIKAALIIDEMDHHPTWSNAYNKVKVRLSTHSEGDIVTNLDRKMAERLDKLFSA